MPKIKTHKGVLKRMKVTGSGKLKHKRAGTSHLNSNMTGNKRRELRKHMTVDKTIAKKLSVVLGRRVHG